MHKKKNRRDTRDKNQVHDTKGEAQNVNIDPDGSNELGGTDKTRKQGANKANEGARQNRDRGRSQQ
jgi:hypothetical protein